MPHMVSKQRADKIDKHGRLVINILPDKPKWIDWFEVEYKNPYLYQYPFKIVYRDTLSAQVEVMRTDTYPLLWLWFVVVRKLSLCIEITSIYLVHIIGIWFDLVYKPGEAHTVKTVVAKICNRHEK